MSGPKRGITLVESLIAAGIFLLIVVVLFSFLSRVFSTSRPSVVQMTRASFLRQETRLAFQKLMDRIEEGIEIISPGPGQSDTQFVFQDLLNHRIHLGINGRGELVTSRMQGSDMREETTPASVQTDSGAQVFPTRPIWISSCNKVIFEVLSPTLVTIVLTLTDAGQTGTLVATVRLRNSKLAE